MTIYKEKGVKYNNVVIPAEMTYDKENQKKIFDFGEGLKNKLGENWQDKWEAIRCGYLGVDNGEHLVSVTLKEKE